MYDGNGSDNCFSMEGVNSTFPADRSTFAGCGGPNAFSESVQDADARLHRRGRAEGVGRSTRTPPSRATRRSRSSSEGRKALIAVLAGAALISAAPAQGAAKKTVTVGDNYYVPHEDDREARHHRDVALARASRQAGDVHDVKLAPGPKGVKKFRSEAASTDYTFKRKLTVPGTYKLDCSLHDEMRMTIKVRKCILGSCVGSAYMGGQP